MRSGEKWKYKIISSDSNSESILYVRRKWHDASKEYYVKLTTYSSAKQKFTELDERSTGYDFESNVLRIPSLEEKVIEGVLQELDQSGDFHEIMQPLDINKKIKLKIPRIFGLYHKLKNYEYK